MGEGEGKKIKFALGKKKKLHLKLFFDGDDDNIHDGFFVSFMHAFQPVIIP